MRGSLEARDDISVPPDIVRKDVVDVGVLQVSGHEAADLNDLPETLVSIGTDAATAS